MTKPFLRIDVANFKVFEFESTHQLVGWLESERNSWNQLRGRVESQSEAMDFCASMSNRIDQLLPDARNSNANLENLQRQIQILFGHDGISVQTPEMVFVQHVGETYGWKTAASALRIVAANRPGRPEGNRGDREELGRQLGSLAIERVPTRGNFQPIQALHIEWNNKLSQQSAEVDELCKKWDGELTRLADRYKAIKALEEPIAYWMDKWKSHRTAAVVSAVGAFVSAWIGGCWLFNYVHDVRDALAEKLASAPQQTASVAYGWLILPHTLPVILAALALFWLLRILVRVFFTQMHSMADAGERVVLIKTYLALREKTGELSKEEQLLIFAEVFRRGGTGVFDDAAPETPLTTLTNLATGTKRSGDRG